MRRREYLRLGGAGLAGALAGCADRTIGRTESVIVEMTDDLTFDPADVTVRADVGVNWRNVSDVGHTVTAYEGQVPRGASYFASGGFDSEEAARNDLEGGLIEPGEGYQVAFRIPGTYEYFCIPHEGSGMSGTIEVEP